MSSLTTLRVQGVRSFGPLEGDEGIIKFISPVTLILGQNGCGKTTLIESLKYATCGELPDNCSRGSAFVHDPKLANAQEARGVVMLKFRDVNGDTVVVSRPMQVVQKQKNLEFKSLEASYKLTKASTGESQTLSTRCVDINNMVTSSIGVSKAILTNVVFCHQEDSGWPLEEAKKVKERFDEIFDSKQYNKCLEEVRKIKKNNKAELTTLREALRFLTTFKDEAFDKRANLSREESRLSSTADIIQDLKMKITPITSRLMELAEREENIGRFRGEYQAHLARHKVTEEAISDLRSMIKVEFTGTDEHLQQTKENFHRDFRNKEANLLMVEREEEELETLLKKNQEQINSEQVKLGHFTRDLEQNKQTITLRNKALLSLSDDLHLKVVTLSQLAEGGVGEAARVVDSIEEALREKQDQVDELRAKHDTEAERLRSQHSQLVEKRGQVHNTVENSKLSLTKARDECKKINHDINEVDRSAESLSVLQRKLDKINRELDEMKRTGDDDDTKQEIEKSKAEKDRLEDNLMVVDKEVQDMQKYSCLKAEIDVKTDQKNSRDAQAKKLLRRHEDSLKNLLGEIPEQGLKMNLQSAMDSLAEKVRMKKEESKSCEKEITTLEAEKKHLLDKLRVSKQTLASDEFAIEQACGSNDYETFVKEMSKRLEDLQDEKGSYTASDYLYRRYVSRLEQQKPCCPLCERDFSTVDEVTALISELNLKIRELPSKIRNNKEELDKVQDEYKNLLQLKSKYEKLENLRNVEIPSLKNEIEKIEQKLKKGSIKLKTKQQEMSALECEEAVARSVLGDVIILEQHVNEVKSLDRDIQILEAKLPPGDERKPLKEVLNEQKELRVRLTVTRDRLETLQNKLTAMANKRSKLIDEKNTIQSQQIKISGNAQMRSQLAEKLEETECMIAMLENDIEKSNIELQELSVKLEQSVREMKNKIAGNADILQDAIDELGSLNQRLRDIRSHNDSINEYEKTGGLTKLRSAQQSLSVLQRKGDDLTSQINSKKKDKEQLKTDIASQKTKEREIIDNITLRIKIAEEKDLNEKISNLKAKIGKLDYTSITVEKNKLKAEEENVNKEKSRAEGKQTELKNIINNLKIELNRDTYKNAEKNYQDKIAEIKAQEAVMEDLNRYYIALDYALRNFHMEKMKAINVIIKDLWRQIYKGNDIDYIEIEADADPSISADKRRVYNYRVVQVRHRSDGTGSMRQDMRGRCSAGQKVLASLIVRIALAETFSSNCGILALDEPTTNLDKQNIRSLTNALVEIVNLRSRRTNFQLIVITHDSEFLEVLRRIDKAPFYYFISRNECGKSKVEKKKTLDYEEN